MSARQKLFVVTTPVPDFETVTCFEDSWSCHIAVEHPDVADQLPAIQQVLSDPTHVLKFSGRVPSNVVFFHENVANDDNEPLFVVVNGNTLTMRTAYFKTAWKNFTPSMLEPLNIVWSKS